MANEITERCLTKILTLCQNVSSKSWQSWGETRALIYCWQECKMVQRFWKTVWQFIKILNIELSCDPEILLLRELKSSYKQIFIPVLSISAQSLSNLTVHQLMNRYILYTGILFAHKRGNNNSNNNKREQHGWKLKIH